MIAGALGGLAGFLLANATNFVSPAYMSWQRSGELHRHGAARRRRLAAWRDHRHRGLSAAEEWLSGSHRALEDDLRAAAGAASSCSRAAVSSALGPMRGCRRPRPWLKPVLRLEALRKKFGGLVVTDNVTLDVLPGELHAVIGPNGAGKTTLINQISGRAAAGRGQHPRSPAGTSRRCRCTRARAQGLARSFQITFDPPRLFGAAKRRAGRAGARAARASVSSAGRPTNRALNEPRHDGAARGWALRAARTCWRAACRTARSARSSSRLRWRWSRKLLLLDEPMAGTGHEETERLIEVLERLKGRFPMILVEHDMTAVFALADRVSVLIYGRILASRRAPHEVRADPAGRPGLSRRREE